MPSIGPTLPPHLAQRSTTPPLGPQLPKSSVESDDDEESYGPSLPPHLEKRPVAPSPAPLPRPSSSRLEPEEEDDDDDIGPRPLPASIQSQLDPRSDAIQRFMEAEERRAKQAEDAKKPKVPTREEWMLVPPSASDLLGNLDPSKLTKARQFSRSTAAPKETDNSLWTETPAERQQRIADEVSGRKRKAGASEPHLSPEEEAEARKRKKLDDQIRKGADEHTRQVRGQALVASHEDKLLSAPTDETPSAIWDHGRDMAVGGRLMDDSSRSKMLKDAKGLGDRFSSGKKGGYL